MMKCVAGYIQRKSMLYVTGVEYGDYTMNHVQGCAHGCKYPCYAYMMKKRFGQVNGYEQWCEPYLVSNTLELLDNEIPKLRRKIKSVQLCFSTDPFMYGYDEIAEMSIAAIQRLNRAGIKCTILTKGILPLELSQLSKDNEYGITLVTLDETFAKSYEPAAAPLVDRLAALKALSDKGCKTWVSMEPYPTPNIIEQRIEPILDSISFSDKIIFGRLNYNRDSSIPGNKEFYNSEAQKVIKYCSEHGIAFHIKEGTITTKQEVITHE